MEINKLPESCVDHGSRTIALEIKVFNLESAVMATSTEVKTVAARVHDLEIADSALSENVKLALAMVEKHVESTKKFQRWMFVVAVYLTLIATDPIHRAILNFMKVIP